MEDQLNKPIIIDVELTNRCNATCDFCPRDNMPQLGKMSFEDFQSIIQRVKEAGRNHRIVVCGTGDPSVHPQFIEFMEYAFEQGIDLEIASNGNRITPEISQRLIDAGLKKMTFSVTGIDDHYKDIYGLPFEKTKENVLAFKEIAGDKCEVVINLVNYKEFDDRINIPNLKKYWQNLGFENFQILQITNRAGALDVKMPKPESREPDFLALAKENDLLGLCPTPFISYHIGWDGKYYLCCHDWRHQASFGHVSTHSIQEIYKLKLDFFNGEALICDYCSQYPANVFAEAGEYRQKDKVFTEEEIVKVFGDIEKQIIEIANSDGAV